MNSSYALPNFSSDYQEGAHARVLDALVATNMEQASGYGTDEHCERARRAPHVEDLIARLECEEVQEPSLVVAGRVSRERRGPLVPIGLRVPVDCAVLCRHGLALHCAYC